MVESRCVLMDAGELSVVTSGIIKMHQSPVINWDYRHMVSGNRQ